MQFYLTDAGRACLARVNAGEMELHFTKAMTGAGNAVRPELQPEVLEPMQQMQIDEVRAEGEYTQIVCVLTNLEWEQEYILRQIGLYARDISGAETLIVIGQDPYGDRIPPITEKEVEYQYHIGMKIDNAQNVSFDFSVNDFLRKKYFYEHLEEFEEYRKDIQDQFEALPRVRIGPAERLDRKDTILFETLPGTDRVTKIRERDAADERHAYDFAAVFAAAQEREPLQSGETVNELMGRIKKWLEDLKPNTFREADNPFVVMTETTYKPPAQRTEGSLYALVTKQRGLIILFFERYIHGTEDPRKELTVYAVDKAGTERTAGEKDENPYKAVLQNLVILEPENEIERKDGVFYAIRKRQKGE